MTPTIQLLMLAIAATIMLSCNVKSSDVASGSVFKSGMVAIVSVFGVAWMADTYFSAYIPAMKKTLSAIVLSYPWLYAAVLFLVSKLINSQAAAVTVIVPMCRFAYGKVQFASQVQLPLRGVQLFELARKLMMFS